MNVVADHLPARCVRVTSQGDHRRVVVLDQVREGDRLPVSGVPRLGQLQLPAPLRRLGPLGPRVLFLAAQRSLVVGPLVLVGEIAGDISVICPGREVGPQRGMLRAFGCRAGGGGLVEGPADLGSGGGEAIQHCPPSGEVPGGRQFVQRAASGTEQCVGVRGQVLGVCLHGRLVTARQGGCGGACVDGSPVAVACGVEPDLGLTVDDGHPQPEVACPVREVGRRGPRGGAVHGCHRDRPPPEAVRWTVGA